MGWEELPGKPSGMEDGPCDWSHAPKNARDLGTTGVAEALNWIPLRLRWSIARVLHFALALYVERLHMEHVHNQVREHYLAYWLVEDVRIFFDDRIANILKHWLAEILDLWEKGNKVEHITSLYIKGTSFIDSPLSNKTDDNEMIWKPAPLSSRCNRVFSRRARLFDYSELASTHGINKMHEDNPTPLVKHAYTTMHRMSMIDDEEPEDVCTLYCWTSNLLTAPQSSASEFELPVKTRKRQPRKSKGKDTGQGKSKVSNMASQVQDGESISQNVRRRKSKPKTYKSKDVIVDSDEFMEDQSPPKASIHSQQAQHNTHRPSSRHESPIACVQTRVAKEVI